MKYNGSFRRQITKRTKHKVTTLQASEFSLTLFQLCAALIPKLKLATPYLTAQWTCTMLPNTAMAPNVKLAINSFPWQDFSPDTSQNFPDFWRISWHFPGSCQIPKHFRVFQKRGHLVNMLMKLARTLTPGAGMDSGLLDGTSRRRLEA